MAFNQCIKLQTQKRKLVNKRLQLDWLHSTDSITNCGLSRFASTLIQNQQMHILDNGQYKCVISILELRCCLVDAVIT
jgi:hypothetical protein